MVKTMAAARVCAESFADLTVSGLRSVSAHGQGVATICGIEMYMFCVKEVEWQLIPAGLVSRRIQV
jgi:hypothetical protein